LLGRDLIHFDLRDPDRAYFRKAPKPEPTKAESKAVVKDDGTEA
jgi:cell division protein FtsQ